MKDHPTAMILVLARQMAARGITLVYMLVSRFTKALFLIL
jgi:hypothetical protein